MTKNIRALLVMRPILFAAALGIGLLIVSSFVAIGFWYHTTTSIKDTIENDTKNFHSGLASQVEQTAKLLRQFSSPVTNLARLMDSSLNSTDFSQQIEMQTKVAPLLFQEFATLPYVSQIAYLGLDGPFWSYYYEGNRSYSMYYKQGLFYKQPVDSATGKLYGKEKKSNFSVGVLATWVSEALNSTNDERRALLGKGWNGEDREIMFVTLAGMRQKKGAVLLGISAETLRHYFLGIDLRGARLNMAARDGDDHQVMLDGIPGARISKIDGDSVFIDTGDGEVTCFLGNGSNLIVPSAAVRIGQQKAALKETQLCRALIKQMESTQQAERKSLKKSLAFATASHEIRNLLTPISSFIHDCAVDLPPGSARATTLKVIHDSTKDLLGFLTAILDASKLEEGKMELEEQQFDVSSVLQDVVDLFDPMAMEKGVEIVLDLSDVLILKFGGRAIGDRGKLKQVLWNLVSNAVKYTDEGQIVVRVRAKEPSLESGFGFVAESTHPDGCSKFMTKFLKWKNHEEPNREKDDEEEEEEENPSDVKQNQKKMEFIFEVDDTGKGIPKDKQKSIFENYVQVKEKNSEGQVGTGLGLGIVQSLVRLMGGEIRVVDKEKDEKGTCFRFDVVLTVSDTNRNNIGTDIETCDQNFNPRLLILSPRSDGSRVVLLIKNEARRRASQKFMKNLGIKVSALEKWENFQPMLKKMKSKLNVSSPYSSSSGKSEPGSRSGNSSSARSKEIPLSAMEDMEQKPVSSVRTRLAFVLLVVDAGAGPSFQELYKAVAEFKTGLQISSFKVVWLDRPNSGRVDRFVMDPNDEILLKPFHGSGLTEVMRLLPEFEGTVVLKPNNETPRGTKFEEWGSSSSAGHQIAREKSRSLRFVARSEIEEEDKPLSGLTFLVVDDSKVVRLVTTSSLSKMGAKFEQCENGVEAVERFRAGLQEQARNGVSHPVLPYDCILMDCQMPKMDGYEATMAIREDERRYGIRTPIIGLTGHTSKEELDRMIEAGMDVHLTKPAQREDILEAVRRFRGQG
ncbi:Histidine kinase CKI1 [Linum grandiflorum]